MSDTTPAPDGATINSNGLGDSSDECASAQHMPSPRWDWGTDWEIEKMETWLGSSYGAEVLDALVAQASDQFEARIGERS